jgi:hypothetical protein
MFYNRLVAQMVAKFVDPGSGITQPLSIYEVGGSGPASLTLASGTETQIVAAPVGTVLWRLHRFVCPDVPGTTGFVALLNGANFYSVLSSGLPSDDLDGQLIGTALSVFNGLPTNARVTLTLDQIGNTQVS